MEIHICILDAAHDTGTHGLLLCKFARELDNAEPSADQGGPRREFFELLKTSLVLVSQLSFGWWK